MAALDDFSLEKVTDKITNIYDNKNMPKNLGRSVFISLPRNTKGCMIMFMQNI